MAVEISKAELDKALAALGEVGASVYSARKEKDGTYVLDLVGRKESLRFKPEIKTKPKAKPRTAKTKEKST
jgi:hypothetical protein